MAVNGIGSSLSPMTLSLVQMRQQIETLQQQLATGKRADTYAGMGSHRSFGIGLRAQLADIAAYADTQANANLRINLANSLLERMTAIGGETRSGALNTPLQLDSNGQTAAQTAAGSALGEMLQLLNTQAGDRYLFSGRAIDRPATAALSEIVDGAGARAGLKQLIAERRQADFGASGLGRIALSQPGATSVALAEDAVSPFGFKLAGVTATLSGATVAGPAGSPPSLSVDLGATNPAPGEKLRVTFTLPDGTSETIELAASSTVPAPAGHFAIGVDTTATAANLATALTAALGDLADTALVAASAMAASDNYFNGAPPLRVLGLPLTAATALTAGTAADTVLWYTGETGPGPARATALARVDQSITVQYGMRADEQGLRWQLQNIAVFAAVTTAAGPDANAQVLALNQRVAKNLSSGQPGIQSIQNIAAELAGAQSAIKSTEQRHQQSRVMLQTMIDQIEGVTNEEIAAKIVALQTNLQASYHTTAMLYELSLVKFI